MPIVRLLTEPDIRRLVPLDKETVDTVRQAFVAFSAGGVEMPPTLSLPVAMYHGEVDVKTAFMPGVPHIAIKISPGFFDNLKIGLPSLNGLMVVLHASTGLLAALLLDNGYLTATRTAAAGAVATDALARRNARVAAVFGTGDQAWLQMQALRLVRPIEEIRVWGRRPDAAASLADRFQKECGVFAIPVDDPRRATSRADIIVTTTPSEQPVLKWDWLSPGQHVTAMGSDAPYKTELEPAIVARADRYVPDSQLQCARLGELRAAVAAGLVPPDRVFGQLGDILRGAAPARTSDAEITVCDLTGTGVQDTAIAGLTLQRAEASMLGMTIDT